MFDVCGTPTEEVKEEKPWMRYDVTTGAGSHFVVYFKHQYNMYNPSNINEVVTELGDMRVIGTTADGREVNLGGLGNKPVRLGDIAVGPGPTPEHPPEMELITSIDRVQEVGYTPPL